jgi:hypothetical protein
MGIEDGGGEVEIRGKGKFMGFVDGGGLMI